MRAFGRDLVFAVRALARRPLFTVAAALTLALGLGANAAIFNVIDQVMLRQPPYRDPERLVMLRLSAAGGSTEPQPLSWSYPDYEDLKSRAQASPSLQGVAAFAGWTFNLTGTETPERLPVEIVSASYFSVLEVPAAHGRVFVPEEDGTAGAHPVVLLGDSLWRRRFGAQPGIVGRLIHLDGRPLTVVGVLPAGFRGLTGQAEAWVPMRMAPELLMPRRLTMRFAHWHEVVGRLKPGAGPELASRELGVFLEQQRQAYPPKGGGRMEARVVRLREDRVDPSLGRALILLSGAVGLVLLIACVNVVNLLLVRAGARQKETAVRVAVGADRRGLVRLFVAEGVALGLLGGVAGALIAFLGIRLAVVFGPETAASPVIGLAPRTFDLGAIPLGLRVLAACLVLAGLLGATLGLVPALRASRTGIGGPSVRGLRRSAPLGLLVVAEIALSLVLLIGAGLMILSFSRLAATRLGFAPEHLLTLRLSHPFKGGPEPGLFYAELMKSVAALPGVEAVTVTNRLPLSISGETTTVRVAGQPERAEPSAAGVHMVGPDHFATLRIPLLRGRAFTARDREGTGRVAIVNATAVRRLFPGEDPLGQRIHLGIGWEDQDFAEVVGVAGDVKYGRLDEPVESDVYVPFAQSSESPVALVVRTRSAPLAMAPEIRRAVRRLDHDLPVFDVQTLEHRIAASTSRLRFGTFLLSLFAAVSCLLAAVGLYGVIASSVAGRTREIGIRVALGASPKQVAGLVMGDGLRLALLGLSLGLALAVAFARILSGFLYRLSATDPATFLAAALLLLTVSLIATFVPTRRAMQVDPGVALRHE